MQNRFGLLPKLYCEKTKFVLQGWNCIAIEVGWLLGDLEILLQYSYCIAGEGWKILYCNTQVCIAEKRAEIVLQMFNCIAIQWSAGGSKVYCNTV